MTDIAVTTDRKPPNPRARQGSGSIAQRKMRSDEIKHEARVNVPKNDATGSPRRQYGKLFATKAEAQEWLNEELAKIASNSAPKDQRLTVESYLSRWLEDNKGDWSPSTRTQYESVLNRHVIPRIGKQRLIDLTPSMLRAAYSSIRKDSREPGRREVTPTTIHLINRVVKSALSKAVEDECVKRNVAKLVHLKEAKRPIVVWSLDEVRTFMEHAATHRYAALWMIYARCGVRRGEALGLRWTDIQLDTVNGMRPHLKIQRQVNYVNGEVMRGELKTGASARTVFIDAATVSALKAWKAVQKADKVAAPHGLTWDSEVFTDPAGRVLNPSEVTKMFGRISKAAGLRRVRLHDLRHGGATYAKANNVSDVEIQKWLGHASLSTTVKTYIHALADNQHLVTDTLSDWFGDATG